MRFRFMPGSKEDSAKLVAAVLAIDSFWMLEGNLPAGEGHSFPPMVADASCSNEQQLLQRAAQMLAASFADRESRTVGANAFGRTVSYQEARSSAERRVSSGAELRSLLAEARRELIEIMIEDFGGFSQQDIARIHQFEQMRPIRPSGS